MSEVEHCYLSAAQANRRFADHSPSPVELMQAPVVACSYDDQRVFSAALACEQAFKYSPSRLDTRITSGD